jgi:multiple antibiotic resistance protein
VLAAWLATVLATFAGLLPIVNPFSTAAVFLAITGRLSEAERRRQATLACLYATGVLLAFLFAGAVIMSFFGISIPALRLAGGLIVARVGFGMLAPPRPDAGVESAAPRADLAFTPLAVPMLSGPGSIAVTIGMAAGAESVADDLAIAVGIVLVLGVSWGVLWSARTVKRFLGEQGIDALTRIMGFLLVCIGVQFVGLAVVEVATDPRFLGAILEALEAGRADQVSTLGTAFGGRRA